jgi:hypothetical protein
VSAVSPDGIHITDGAIIPMNERVVDRRHDLSVSVVGTSVGAGRVPAPTELLTWRRAPPYGARLALRRLS